MYPQKTMILPAAVAPLARALAYAMAGEAAAGMWTVGLSADGGEATHYISSGAVGEEFNAALTDADALWQAVQAAGADAVVSQAQCQTLVASADVSDLSSESALEAMARLGLQFAGSAATA